MAMFWYIGRRKFSTLYGYTPNFHTTPPASSPDLTLKVTVVTYLLNRTLRM